MTLVRRVLDLCESMPHWFLALIARTSIAAVFWQSGRTKVDDLTIKPQTFALFEHEYKVPLLPPEMAAYLATIAEHVFPILLVVGLASRLSAFALLGMTAVIQVFVYPLAWPTHLLWASVLLYVVARGPGPVALDRFVSFNEFAIGRPK